MDRVADRRSPARSPKRPSLLVGLLACASLLVGCGDGKRAADQPDLPSPAATVGIPSVPAAPSPASTPATTATGPVSARLPDATAPALLPPVLGSRTSVATTSRDPAFRPLPGTSGYHGRLGSAVYRVEIPSGWHNGPLLVWAHGFRGFGADLSVSSPPGALREAVIASGYAWAASSYTENGYTPGIGADDTRVLLRFFEQRFGRPVRTVIAGESMGGNVTVLALEQFAGEFAGGLSFCGAVGGVDQLDYLLSWALVGEYLTGARLPIGEASALVLPALLKVSVGLGSPGMFTSAGRQFESVIRELTGGARPFFVEGLADQFATNFGLLAADPERRAVNVGATTNVGVVYEVDPATGIAAAAINDGIRRIPPVPGTRDPAAHPDAVPTTGRLAAPLLTLHNTGDLFVPISLEVDYRAKVEALGLGDRLVQRAIRAGGHCQFSSEEYVAAWLDFRAWVEAGTRPAGEVLGDDLSDAGRRFTRPVRAGDPGGR